MTNALYLLSSQAYDLIYGPAERAEIADLVTLCAPPQTAASLNADPSPLAEVEILLSGWGMPVIDAAFLVAAPRLRAVFYGAGSIRYFMSEAAWQRGLTVVSAYAANAVPVAEYALGAILLSLKQVWYYALGTQRSGQFPARIASAGGYGSTVGLVSLGMIGRLVARRLAGHDLQVLAYDPFATPAEASGLKVQLCSLEELFQHSDVVSLHTPWLKETEGLITGAHFASMKPGATFINTARGAVVRENELIAVLQQRQDLHAILDVTYPEPPEPGSPLYSLPNVVLTPHIAGSVGAECRRMGRLVVDELRRYLNGQPLEWVISRAQSERMA
jgi:phosphoglycerate dehydrogenase-like enzyme